MATQNTIKIKLRGLIYIVRLVSVSIQTLRVISLHAYLS